MSEKNFVYVIDEKFAVNGVETWKPVYVGSTGNVAERFRNHCKPGFAGRAVTDAIIERGVENFRVRSVGEYATRELARLVEDAMMNALDTVENGYNRHSSAGTQVKNAKLVIEPIVRCKRGTPEYHAMLRQSAINRHKRAREAKANNTGE